MLDAFVSMNCSTTDHAVVATLLEVRRTGLEPCGFRCLEKDKLKRGKLRMESLISNVAYERLLAEIKQRIISAQTHAALAVIRELILLYWQIGLAFPPISTHSNYRTRFKARCRRSRIWLTLSINLKKIRMGSNHDGLIWQQAVAKLALPSEFGH